MKTLSRILLGIAVAVFGVLALSVTAIANWHSLTAPLAVDVGFVPDPPCSDALPPGAPCNKPGEEWQTAPWDTVSPKERENARTSLLIVLAIFGIPAGVSFALSWVVKPEAQS
jgi:hypothetical protein